WFMKNQRSVFGGQLGRVFLDFLKQRRLPKPLEFIVADVAHAGETAENQIAPGKNAPVLSAPRARQQSGQSRGFERSERRRRLAEVELRRRFGAVNVASPFDDVKIDLENALLRKRLLELARDDDLLQLAQRIFRRVQIKILGELHGDRAAAAVKAPGFPVFLERLFELFEIDSPVAEKRRVLVDQHGLFEMLRERAVGDPDLAAREAQRFLPVFLVAELHQRGGFRIALFQHRNVGQRVVDVAADADDNGDQKTFKQN